MSKADEAEATTDSIVDDAPKDAELPVEESVPSSDDSDGDDWDEDGDAFEDSGEDSGEADEETESEATQDEGADESKDEEAEESQGDDVAEQEEKPVEQPIKQESEDDSSKEEPQPKDKKLSNDEAAKRRIAEKKLKEERKAREEDNLRRYLEEAGEDEVEQLKRQNEIDAYRIQQAAKEVAAERSQVLQSKLEADMQRALADIDLLKPDSPEPIKEHFARAVDFFEARNVRRDEDGNYIGIDGDLYELLKKEADSIRQLTGLGARQESKDKAKQKQRVDKAPSKKPKEPDIDEGLAAFDEEADLY